MSDEGIEWLERMARAREETERAVSGITDLMRGIPEPMTLPDARKPRKRVECWGVAFDDGEVLPEQFKEDAEESLRNWTEGDGDHCGARLIHLREVEDGSSTLPDTLVEKAARGISRHWQMDEEDWEEFEPHARAALEAAAPSLIAQGMRMAAEMADKTFCELIIRTPALYCEPANYCTQGARARAAEIEREGRG